MLLLVISLIKMVPKCSAEMLCRYKKAVTCLMERNMSHKFCLNMTYSAAGHEFNVNQSTTILNKVCL